MSPSALFDDEACSCAIHTYSAVDTRVCVCVCIYLHIRIMTYKFTCYLNLFCRMSQYMGRTYRLGPFYEFVADAR